MSLPLCLSAERRHLCMDRVGEPDVEGVIVLNQGCLLVMEHQLLQGAVQVVGFRKAVSSSSAVDDTVLHVPVCTERQHRENA